MTVLWWAQKVEWRLASVGMTMLEVRDWKLEVRNSRFDGTKIEISETGEASYPKAFFAR
jgi:hypothetical protein